MNESNMLFQKIKNKKNCVLVIHSSRKSQALRVQGKIKIKALAVETILSHPTLQLGRVLNPQP